MASVGVTNAADGRVRIVFGLISTDVRSGFQAGAGIRTSSLVTPEYSKHGDSDSARTQLHPAGGGTASIYQRGSGDLSAATAREIFWPGQDPIGKRISFRNPGRQPEFSRGVASAVRIQRGYRRGERHSHGAGDGQISDETCVYLAGARTF